MTPQNQRFLDLHFRLICKHLTRGGPSFTASHEAVPAIKVTITTPIETALERLYMLQDYKADHQNKETFSSWYSEADEFSQNAMTHFLSLPLYGHSEFRMDEDDHVSLVAYAESALSEQPVEVILHRGALVTNITREICRMIN
jgi:hypothetical protein